MGKSELLKQLMAQLQEASPERQVVYINKELRAFDAITDYQSLNAYISEQGVGTNCAILIDEVQEIAEWERSAGSFLAEGMDVYLTGSNAHMLSSDLATLLAGRYVEFQVFALSFHEFLALCRREHETVEDAFKRYLTFGGLPGLHHLDADAAATYQFLDAICQTVLLKDIVKRHGIRNVDLLENITRYVFDNIGNIFSPNSVSKYLKSQGANNSLPTVQTHVRYLADTFMVHRARQYDLKGKRHLETLDKFFVGDLGLRHAVSGYRQADIAGMLENVCYLELLRRGWRVSVGRMGKTEVDFVADKEQRRAYIQVTYLMPTLETREREFSILEAIPDNHPKYVISMDPVPLIRESGVQHLRVLDFLQQKTILR